VDRLYGGLPRRLHDPRQVVPGQGAGPHRLAQTVTKPLTIDRWPCIARRGTCRRSAGSPRGGLAPHIRPVRRAGRPQLLL